MLAWYYTLAAFIVGILLGAVIARKFGTDWLSMLAWMVGDNELTMIAKIAWDAGLVPATMKKLLFGNDVEKFVAWVLEKAHGLEPKKFDNVTNAATSRGFTTGR